MSKPIYVLCLHNVRTGGPEAIHQLSDALIEQGFDARMVYYDWAQIAALEQAVPSDGYHFGARENPIEEYARYKVNVTDSVPNAEGVIVVLPETLCHLAPKFDKATVLIWWLSVDNGFGALSRVNLNHLRAANVKHAAQSEYAARFCGSLGFDCNRWLSDYTVDLSEYATPLPLQERPPLVVFNATPHKVVANLKAIEDALRKIDPTIWTNTVNGRSREEIAEMFAEARLYVDLGSFPGKDRMPREAASMGCTPLCWVHGAGAECGWYGLVWPEREIDPQQIAESIVLTLRAEDQPRMPDLTERGRFRIEVQKLFRDL